MLKSYCQKQKLKYRSEKKAPLTPNGKGFTLAEAAASIIILAFICSSVLVAINRSMESAADVTLQMQAFEIARENMEQLISTDSVKEYTDFGYSEEHPQIQWQTTVESFFEPITDRLWIQAVCAAEYTDSKGELKKVELTHWLTDLSTKQILELIKERKKQQDYLALIGQLIETLLEAAEYAGVDEETVEQWADNGMPVTEDGYFIKVYIDLYKRTNGNPSEEEIEQAEETFGRILLLGRASGGGTQPGPERPIIEPPGPEEQEIGCNCDGLPFCEYFICVLTNCPHIKPPGSELGRFFAECMN